MNLDSIVGTLEVLGEVKPNSLKEKIMKQFRNNIEHCSVPDLKVPGSQNNGAINTFNQLIESINGRRTSRRSGRQLRYYRHTFLILYI